MDSQTRIPRRIIQTARTRDLPPLARAASANLRLLHPDWEYLFFDDEDVQRFIAGEFPQHRALFEAFPHRIQRFDFFRYLAVLRFGGFYFDLDVLLAESLVDLRPRHCVFAFEELTLSRYLRRVHGIDWEIGNYAFGAAAGHPFLAAVVENCVRAQRDPAWARQMLADVPTPFRSRFEVLNTTGPGLLTRTLVEQPAAARNVTVLHPADVRDPRTWHQFGRYGIHLMEGSWRDRGGYLSRKAALLWENWTRRRLHADSDALGALRTFNLPKPA